MRWFWLFVKEDVSRSFRLWERGQAVIALITAGVAAFFTLVIRSQLPGFSAGPFIGIGLGLWFFLLVFVFTPGRMAMEKVEITAKRLRVVGSENYDGGSGYNWLRLKVENPTGVPMPNCYGKLCERKMVATDLIIDGQEARVSISPERGGQGSEAARLPAEGHKFPWSPESGADTTITIAGFNSREYLYYAVKHKRGGGFWFPPETGIEYGNFSLGDFELEIEVGSGSETFKPTRVCVTFRAAGGDLKFVGMRDIN